MRTATASVNIVRGKQRFHTALKWLDSYHSFSFGPFYDPENTQHGLLLVSNDDIIRPGTGFQTHPHQDMEIVTWVLSGELEHKDSVGNKGIIYPGLAQRMSAGRGIWHSEINPNKKEDVHLVQMWVLPDEEGISPSYEQLDIGKNLEKGGLIPIASGKDIPSAIRIHQKGATLWVGQLKPGESVFVPDSPYVHLYVAEGSVELEETGTLGKGDAARLSGAGARALRADEKTGAQILIWEMV